MTKDEFELRGKLATLKCWHRLSQEEEEDLLSFAAAQEPLECLDCGSSNVGIPATYDSLINSVKAQPAQEPVMWTGVDFDIKTAPPQRPWVGLTDEEIRECFAHVEGVTVSEAVILISVVRTTQASLKEKNT